MVKRDITETIYEYDKEGKLIKKTITETHEEEEGTTLTYPGYPYPTNPCTPNTIPDDDWWRKPPYITWSNTGSSDTTGTYGNTTTTTTATN